MSEELKPGYELVYTVTDYYDGPRQGIANYQGEPHLYECIFDEVKDNYSEVFELTPLSPEIFHLAMEDWSIWRRWELAFHTGQTDNSTHPALPQDAARHAELKRILDQTLVTNRQKAFTQVGEFEVIGKPNLPKGVLRPLQVRWVPTEPVIPPTNARTTPPKS